MTRCRCRLALLALCLLAGAAGAASLDTDPEFRAAVAAFREGDHEGARSLFEKLRARHPGDGRLLYNLGTTYYRLADYAAARAAFVAAAEADPSQRPLCWYNLGLVALQLGDNSKARRWLERSIAATDDAPLRELARRALVTAAEREQARARWTLGFAAGHSDNVIALTDSERFALTGQSSLLSELSLSGISPRLGSRRAQLRAYASLIDHRYADSPAANVMLIGAGLQGVLARGERRGTLNLAVSRLDFGGEGYQRIFTAGTAIGPLTGSDWKLSYRYGAFAELGTLAAGTAGRQHTVIFALGPVAGRWKPALELRRQWNFRHRVELSPIRDEVRAGLQLFGWSGGALDALWIWRDDVYRAGVARRDTLQRGELALTLRRSPRLALRLKLLRADNRSNEAAFAYRQTQITAGVEYRP